MNSFNTTNFTGAVTFSGEGKMDVPVPATATAAASKGYVDDGLAEKQAASAELTKVGVLGADIASASTINLETATGQTANVTGTTPISAITLGAGHARCIRFTGALTLVNSANLILPTGANIVTVAGDVAWVLGYAGDVVRLMSYQRASGMALAGVGSGTVTSVDLAMPGGFAVGGGPVTSSGGFTVTTALAGLIKASGGDFEVATPEVDYATPAALDLKAPLADAALTGTPSAPTPTAGNNTTRIATTAFVSAAIGLATIGVGKRMRIRVATTANITIATALNSGDVLDGITLANGDLVLVKNQDAPAQNGVYDVGPTPSRTEEFDTFNEYPGSMIGVTEGTVNADTLWFCTSNAGGTLDSTAIVFTKLIVAGELMAANNLSDLANAGTARTNMGLGNVTNTADADKPVSTAQQTALDLKQNLPGAPFNAGNITGSVTLNYANGIFQKAAATGNITSLNPPSNGVEGARLEVWITASGGARTLTPSGSILLPSDLDPSPFPKTIPSGKKYLLILKYDGAAWMFVSLIGAY